MAKVSGPFMSVDASGTIYKNLDRVNLERKKLHSRVFQAHNPNTDNQIVQRGKMAAAVAAWQALVAVTPESGAGGDEEYKDQWNVAARAVYPPISGFNYYVMQYLLEGVDPTIPAIAPQKAKTIHG